MRETELVSDQVALAEGLAADKEELAYRLLGNAHEDVLTAFEATLKTVYLYGKSMEATGPLSRVGNAFQNVERATERFVELGLDPFSSLSEPEMDALRLNIQKRHVIGHNLGVVDDKFGTHALDAKVGETVHLVGEDVRQFALIGQKVIDNLDAWLGGAPSPTIGQYRTTITQADCVVDPDDPQNLMALDLRLSLLARRVGLWVAEHCPDGRGDYVNLESLEAAFADNSEAELQEAIAELDMDGYVKTSRMSGSSLPGFCPTLDLYLCFDRIAFERSPEDDIVTVAELVRAGSDSVDTEEIFSKTGWDDRRFNPVIEYVASQLPDGRAGRYYGTRFDVTCLSLLPEDRVALKRLIVRLKS